MSEYIIINNKTKLILDSFTTEKLALIVKAEYEKTGVKCHIEKWAYLPL